MTWCAYCNEMLSEVYECALCHKIFCSYHEAPESHNCEALEIKVFVKPGTQEGKVKEEQSQKNQNKE